MFRPYRAATVRVLTFALILAMLGCTQQKSPTQTPRLILDDSVGSDLKSLAQETWHLFLDAFQGRTNCFGDVTLRAARDLRSRGSYDPDSATVTVQVPATIVMLQGALIHEWAHHLEFECEAQQVLRPAFLTAQGLPTDTPWRIDYIPADTPESEWARIPSEQFAEATIEFVLGRRQIPTTVRVRVEAVNVIAEWASDR